MPTAKQKLPPVKGAQREKFESLARDLECDEDEAAFKAKLVKIAKAPRQVPEKKP